MKGRHIELSTIVKYTVLIIGASIMIIPFIWMLSTSLKPSEDILSWPPELLPKRVTIANYVTVFETAPFVRFFMNSVIMASISTLSILFTSTLSGYVFGNSIFPSRIFSLF